MDIQPQQPSSEKPPRGVGVAVFVLSVACAVGLWSRMRPTGGNPGPRGHTRAALPDSSGVEGWAGTLELARDDEGASALHARLLPLHADPDRQDFDGRALERRLDLGPGAPWRLVVTYLRAGNDSAESVSLAGWSVVDAEGPALRPIVEGAQAGADPAQGALDPLRSLLAVPSRLEPGHEVTLVLWGRAPGSELTIAGPVAEGRTWDLSARRFDGFPSQPSLARLDRRPPVGIGDALQTPR